MGSTRRPPTTLRLEHLEDRTTPTTLSLADQAAAGRIAGDRILVTMQEGVSGAALPSAPFVREIRSLGFEIYSVRLNAGASLEAAVDYYDDVAGVLAAEADPIVRPTRRPNDPQYGQLYGPARIGTEAVWNRATGNPNFVVAVLDTGVDYTHPDLAANAWRNPGETPGNGVDDDNNGYIDDVFGWDFANDDNDPAESDPSGHGTHVAGTIGAVGNNGVGVAGINWNVKIMALNFLGSGPNQGTIGAQVEAINYAVMMGAKVTNNSYGGAGTTVAEARAVGSTRDAGHIFVVAAGNDSADNDTTPNFPTNYSTRFDNVISVAATDRLDQLADFSNFGARSVTLAAPGVDIVSTLQGNTYGALSGTSMATPHVAGAIALYWGANPTLTAAQVINKLKSSVDVLPQLQGLMTTGGRLNVAKMFLSDNVPPVVVGAPAGSELVRVLDTGGTTARTLNPYPGFLGGVEAASGDVTGDGVADVLTAATLGGHVKVFDGANGRELRSFFAFPGYVGPISVSIGDLNGDRAGELIVSASVGGHVKVFDGRTGALTFSSLVYSGYQGVVAVTTGDTDGDGRNELLTAANGAQGIHVKAFAPGATSAARSFLATTAGPWNNFSLAANDIDFDGIAELLVSQGPRVRVINSQTQAVRADFLAFDPKFMAPVTVTTGRYTGDPVAELVVIAEDRGRSHVKVYEDLNFTQVDSFFAGTR